MFKITLGSFGALVSKWTEIQQQLGVEQSWGGILVTWGYW